MDWFFVAVIGVFSSSLSNIIQRVVMKGKESDPLASSIIFQFVVALMTGLFALYKGFVAPPISTFPLQFFMSAVFYGLGTLCMFQAAKRIGASEKTILSACGAIVTIVIAVIFLKESFTIKQFVGTIVIIVSVALVQKGFGIARNIGTLYTILGTSLYAIAVVSDTVILRHYDAISYTPIISFLPGVVLLAIQPRVVLRVKKIITWKYMRHMGLYSFFYGIQAILYYVALNLGANASQMAPLFRSEIIVTVLLAVIFLKEKENLLLKLISALLVTGGVLLIR